MIKRSLSVPIFLLGLGILAFGVQVFWLGFYLDDWVVLYQFFRGGFERLNAYSFDVNRPFGAWPWWIGFSFAGFSPVKWQIWGLAWRWLTGVLLWWGWKEIFPERKLDITLAAAVFLVSPIFLQQFNALTFSDHWMCFALYALSILCMVYSLKYRRYYWALTGLALLASGAQLFTIEYFAGLEFIRPLLLWFLIPIAAENKNRLKRVLLYELPYALLLGAFLTWRFALMPTGGTDRNSLKVLEGLSQHPGSTLIEFALSGMRDSIEAVVGTWYKTYQPASLSLTPFSNLVSWGVVIFGFLISLVFFFALWKKEPEQETLREPNWIWLGSSFLIMAAGFLPGWMIDSHLVSSGNYMDRFGLAAMFGASLFTVSLASILLRRNHKIILACILIGLAAGFHFRSANTFRWAWERQSRLAWQLHWRMPALLPKTAVYGDGVMTSGSWVDIAWINFLYGAPGDKALEDYWYYDLNKFAVDDLPQAGQEINEKRIEHLAFQGNTRDSLVVQFKTVEHQCLWVVSESSLPNPYLNPKVLESLPLVNVGQIQDKGEDRPVLSEVFGDEPAHDWCFYYQKAELAVQEKQWDEVNRLWQEANTQGLKTGVAAEYLPFIYGTAVSGNFQPALEISRRAKSIDLKMKDPICQIWEKVLVSPENTFDNRVRMKEGMVELGCESGQ